MEVKQLVCDDVVLQFLPKFQERVVEGHLSRGLDQDLTLTARVGRCDTVPWRFTTPTRGVQYAATACVERLQAVAAAVSMAAVGEPRENGMPSG